MQLLVLDYPITRPYPWKRFTLWTIIGTIPVLCLIILFNVAAVGYNRENFYSEQYDPPMKYWWTPITSGTKENGHCEPHRLNVLDRFTTITKQQSLFQYTIEALGETSGNRATNMPPMSSGAMDMPPMSTGAMDMPPMSTGAMDMPAMVTDRPGMSYTGTPLSSCSPNHILVNIVPPESTTTLKLHMTCYTGNIQLNISTSLVISADRGQDTIFSSFLRGDSESLLRENPVSSPVLKTLIGFGLDSLNTLSFSPRPAAGSITDSLNRRHLDLKPNCPAQYFAAETINPAVDMNCADLNRSWNISAAFLSFSSGYMESMESGVNILGTETALAVTVNMVHIFVSSVFIDLGFNSNLFTMTDLIQKTISPFYNISQDSRGTSGWSPSPGVQFGTPFVRQFFDASFRASAGIALPIPRDAVHPTSIRAMYLCRRWRLKTPLSFIASVAAATASFALSIWGLFKLISTFMAKQTHDYGNHCTCHMCSELSRIGAPGVQTPPPTSTSERSESDRKDV